MTSISFWGDYNYNPGGFEQFEKDIKELSLRPTPIISFKLINYPTSDKIAVIVRYLKYLESMTFNSNWFDNDSAKALKLGLNTRLTYLDIGHTEISDEGIEALELHKNKSLTYLDLCGASIKNQGLEYFHLDKNTSLKTLLLSTIWLEDDQFKNFHFKENRSLTRLDLSRNNITSKGAQELDLNSLN